MLSPELETQLAAVAAQRGLSPETTLAQLLSEATDFHNALDGIRRGMADGDAGRETTLEEYRALLAREDAAR